MPLTANQFREKYYTKEELIKIAKNNNSVCIDDINYTISYIADKDKFQIVYSNPDIMDYMVDYFYIMDHFR